MGANFSEFFDDEEEDLENVNSGEERKRIKEVNFDEDEPTVEKKVRPRSPPPQANSLIQTKVKTRKRRQKQQKAKTAVYRKW